MQEDTIELWDALKLVGVSKRQYMLRSPKHVRKLSETQVKEIRVQYWCHKVSMVSLARTYDVSHTTVRDVIHRKRCYKED